MMLPRRLVSALGRACPINTPLPVAAKSWGAACKTYVKRTTATKSYSQQYTTDHEDVQQDGRGPRGSGDLATSSAPSVPFADARSLQEWTDIFEFRENLTDRDCSTSLKAVAKLLRSEGRRADAALQRRVTEAITSIFSTALVYLDAMPPFVKTSLLSNISSLSTFFGNSREWRDSGPHVPVYLMDPLLDDVLANVHTLRPFHLAMLFMSLEKLQLNDAPAYSLIVDNIIAHLNDPHEDPDRSILVPSTLSMMATSAARIVEALPDAVPVETQAQLFTKIAAAVEGLVRTANNPMTEHRAFTSLAATFKDLPPSVTGDFGPMFTALGGYVLDNVDALKGPQLTAAAAGFATGAHADARVTGAVADATQRQLVTLDPASLARTACELAEAADPPLAVLQDVAWECLTREPEARIEAKCQALWAAAKGGAMTPDLMHDFLEAHGDLVSAPYSLAVEKATWHLLDALRLSGDAAPSAPEVYSDAEGNLSGWMASGALRLWRIVAFMKLYARSPVDGNALFFAATNAIASESEREAVGGDLSALLIEALQAAVLGGHVSTCDQILAMPELLTGLAGTPQQQFTQVLALMASEVRDGPDANAEPVWRALYANGGLDPSHPEVVAHCASSLRCGRVTPSTWVVPILAALGITDDALAPTAAHPLQYLSPSGLIDLLEALMPVTSDEMDAWAQGEARYLSDGLEWTMSTLSSVSPNALSAVAGGTATERASATVEILRRALMVSTPGPAPPSPDMAVNLAAPSWTVPDEPRVESDFQDLPDFGPADGVRVDTADVEALEAGMPETKAAIEELSTARQSEESMSWQDAGFEPPAAAAAARAPDESQLRNMVVAQLKDLLRERELPVTGRKADLIQRILNADSVPAPSQAGDVESWIDSALASDDFAEASREEAAAAVAPEAASTSAPVGAAAAPQEPSYTHFEDMKLAQLKDACRARSLKVTGAKAQLIARLMESHNET